MKSKTTKAIILGQKKIGENDKLVFLYTEDFGKLKTIVRGARKMTSKFTGHLETLNTVTVTLYFGPKNILITEISSSQNLLNNPTFETLKTGIQIAEITNILLEENHIIKGLMELLTSICKKLNQIHKPEILLTCYIIKFLDLLGFMPDFKESRSRMDQKYVKFFNYAKEESLINLHKINLETVETQYITQTLKNFIENEVNKKIIHL